MAKWRVWNRHPNGLTHREKFKDEMIEIKSGEYVLMDYEDAVQFRGQYFPMKKDPMGAPDPKGFKVLELQRHEAEKAQDVREYICHFDGRKFPTQALLDQYLTENYADHTFKDESLDEELERDQKNRRGKKDKSA
jgi:hypothetical protein